MAFVKAKVAVWGTAVGIWIYHFVAVDKLELVLDFRLGTPADFAPDAPAVGAES